MKKFLNKIVLTFLVIAIVFSFSACRGSDTTSNSDNADITGNSLELSEWIVTKAASCESEGIETLFSKVDNAIIDTRTTAVLGHNWDTWAVTTEPGCLVAGVETRVCQDCGNKDVQPVAALGHDWGEWKIMTPSTCSKAGIEMKVCDRDENHTDVRSSSSYGHNWSAWVVTTAPTCETDGIETRLCRNDNLHTETRSIEAYGHDWSNWIIITEPTETVNGEKWRVCKNDKAHEETVVAYFTEYYEVIEPINEVSLWIMNDLTQRGIVDFSFLINPKLSDIRIAYNSGLHLFVYGDKFSPDNVKSEFLRQYYIIILESEDKSVYTEEYGIVRQFITQARYLHGADDFVTKVLPLAQSASEAIRSIYEKHIQNQESIRVAPSGNSDIIYVKGNTIEHNVIKGFLNGYIIDKRIETLGGGTWENLPLIVDEEIEIAFGGDNENERVAWFKYRPGGGRGEVILYVRIQDRSILTDDVLHYFTSVFIPGYVTFLDPVPFNDEYLGLFQELTRAANNVMYYGYTTCGSVWGEDTFIFLRSSLI